MDNPDTGNNGHKAENEHKQSKKKTQHGKLRR
jgi:hypothetical protein